MSELDEVDQFMQGLKEPLRKQCIWDPTRRGPLKENFQDLVEGNRIEHAFGSGTSLACSINPV